MYPPSKSEHPGCRGGDGGTFGRSRVRKAIREMTDEARGLLDGQLKCARARIAVPDAEHRRSVVTVPGHLQTPSRCAAVGEPFSIALSQRLTTRTHAHAHVHASSWRSSDCTASMNSSTMSNTTCADVLVVFMVPTIWPT